MCAIVSAAWPTVERFSATAGATHCHAAERAGRATMPHLARRCRTSRGNARLCREAVHAYLALGAVSLGQPELPVGSPSLTEARTTRLLAPRLLPAGTERRGAGHHLRHCDGRRGGLVAGRCRRRGNDARGGCRGDAAASVMSQT